MTTENFIISDISMEGFQVVRSQYFCRQIEPCMTIWDKRIAFNLPAYAALNNCEAVQFFVNKDDRKILVKPAPTKETDSVNWIRNPKAPKQTRLECSLFTAQLFDAWEWDSDMRYRAYGKLVSFDRKVMLLFNFSQPEKWKGMRLVK